METRKTDWRQHSGDTDYGGVQFSPKVIMIDSNSTLLFACFSFLHCIFQLFIQAGVACINGGTFLYRYLVFHILSTLVRELSEYAEVFFITVVRISWARITLLPTWIQRFLVENHQKRFSSLTQLASALDPMVLHCKFYELR